MDINFFVRKKFPGYFSIEQLFSTICDYNNIHHHDYLKCEIKEMPHFFGPFNFFKNLYYTRSSQALINHITGDIHYVLFGCSSKSLNVLTIHDCVLLEKYKKTDVRYWVFRILWYEIPMRRADLITVISDKTRKDLIKKINYGREKIKVVPNFVNNVFRYSIREFNKEKPVLLFIGSTTNKNLDRVLESIKGISCILSIVGKISDDQKTRIKEYNLNVEIAFELTIEELSSKYESCDAVLFPSLYEGFGMPIIEANAVGRPVITSSISPMLEIAANSGAFVDPESVESIREGILKIIQDDEYRNDLIKNGIVNAKRFTIERVAESYINLYKEFASRKGIFWDTQRLA